MKAETFVSDSKPSSFHIYAFSLANAEMTGSNISKAKISEIESLADLPEGWDFGMGRTIIRPVIEKAKQAYSIANLLQLNAEILPQTAGGIILNFYKSSSSEYFLEVTVNADLSIDYVMEKGKGINYEVIDEEENVTLSNLQAKLSTLSSSPWNSPEHSISRNIHQSNRGSVVIVSPIITVEYPSFERTVRYI